ncbi:hypothetical protein CWI32_13890 [Acinetobacter pseudolwoffii]|uniref:Uncharacterized protein n=1 Tax=Acinetobacter pseudolwoffii TaxID=2053287 RepID=A0A2H9YNW7_9GAMM|nr:hypothetical protein CWI32_13890 [Acinetobacter pseudolwoffii]
MLGKSDFNKAKAWESANLIFFFAFNLIHTLSIYIFYLKMNKKILIWFDQRKRYPYDNYITAKSVIGRGNPHLNVLKSHF